VRKVAHVDVDANHDNGVQTAFEATRVLTESIHPLSPSPAPGTRQGADGTTVNIAVSASTARAAGRRAFYPVVPGVVRVFRPEILITQYGADSHPQDLLADLNLTINGHRTSYLTLPVGHPGHPRQRQRPLDRHCGLGDIALKAGRRVILAFDFDATVKPSVHEPLDRLAANLTTKGADVACCPQHGVGCRFDPIRKVEEAVEGQSSGSVWALPQSVPLHSAARTPRVCAHSCSTGQSAATPSR